MKKLTAILLVLCSLIFFQNVLAHVTLLYPIGGETFQTGEVVEIQWSEPISHGPADWDLYFSDDGGSTWQSIAPDLPHSQLDYNWTVPDIATDSGQVKVIQDNMTYMDYTDACGNFIISITTGINESKSYTESFILYPAYPNPFNPNTTIRYDLDKRSRISLTIHNVVGERVRTLVDEFQSPGSKSVIWNGRNDQGQLVGSGFYIYLLRAGDESKANKMTLLK